MLIPPFEYTLNLSDKNIYIIGLFNIIISAEVIAVQLIFPARP